MASAIQKLFAKRKAKQAAKRAGSSGNDRQLQQQRPHAHYDVANAHHDDVSRMPASQSTSAAFSVPFPAGSNNRSKLSPSRSSLDANTLLTSSTEWPGRAAKGRADSTASAPMLDTIAPAACGAGQQRKAEYLSAFQHDQPSDDDDEDPAESVVYRAISNAQHHSQAFAAAFTDASIILVPTDGALTDTHHLQELTADIHWLALHLFVPSRLFKDQYSSMPLRPLPHTRSPWQGVTSTMTLDLINGTATLECRRAPRSVTLVIANDTTVYRSIPATSTATPSAELSFHVVNRQTKHKMVSKKIRLLSVHGLPFIPDTMQNQDKAAMPPPVIAEVTRNHLSLPAKRAFFQDLLCLVSPGPLQPALSRAFSVVFKECRNLDQTFLFVPQYEEHNRQKLRESILIPAQRLLSESFFETGRSKSIPRAHLALINATLENVMMGYLHQRIFPSVAQQPHLQEADARLSALLAPYQSASLSQLGVQHKPLMADPHKLNAAIVHLASLRAGHPQYTQDALVATVLDDPTALQDQLRKLAQGRHTSGMKAEDEVATLFVDRSDIASAARSPHCHGIQTPLDIVQALADTINSCQEAHQASTQSETRARRRSTFSVTSCEAGVASGSSSPTHPGTFSAEPLSTDELLPILSYVVVRSGVSQLPSLLEYAHAYGQMTRRRGKDVVRADANEWALVTFKAVCEWLLTDPLNLQATGTATSAGAINPGNGVDGYGSDSHGQASPSKSHSPSPPLRPRTSKRDRRRSLPTSSLLYAAQRDGGLSTALHGTTMGYGRSASPSSSVHRGSPDFFPSMVSGASTASLGGGSQSSEAGAGESYLSFGALSEERRGSGAMDEFGGSHSNILLSAPGPSAGHMSREPSRASSAARSISSHSSVSTNELTIRRQIRVDARPSAQAAAERLGSPTSVDGRGDGAPQQSPTFRVVGSSSPTPSDPGHKVVSSPRLTLTRAESEGPPARGAMLPRMPAVAGYTQTKMDNLTLPRRQSIAASVSKELREQRPRSIHSLMDGELDSDGLKTVKVASSTSSWLPSWLSGPGSEGAPDTSGDTTGSATGSRRLHSPDGSMVRSSSGSAFSTSMSESSSNADGQHEGHGGKRRRGSIGLGLALASRTKAESIEQNDECATPTVEFPRESERISFRATAEREEDVEAPSALAPKPPRPRRRSRLLSGSKSTLHGSVAAPMLALQEAAASSPSDERTSSPTNDTTDNGIPSPQISAMLMNRLQLSSPSPSTELKDGWSSRDSAQSRR